MVQITSKVFFDDLNKALEKNTIRAVFRYRQRDLGGIWYYSKKYLAEHTVKSMDKSMNFS
jgi:hypothetical protein